MRWNRALGPSVARVRRDRQGAGSARLTIDRLTMGRARSLTSTLSRRTATKRIGRREPLSGRRLRRPLARRATSRATPASPLQRRFVAEYRGRREEAYPREAGDGAEQPPRRASL